MLTHDAVVALSTVILAMQGQPRLGPVPGAPAYLIQPDDDAASPGPAGPVQLPPAVPWSVPGPLLHLVDLVISSNSSLF